MHSQAIDFHPPTDEAATFLLPPADLFARRAARFAHLAEGHSLADWLRFLGRLSQAQAEALQAIGALPLPAPAALARARTHGMPPLNPGERPAQWREALRRLSAAVDDDTAPDGVRNALAVLRAADDSQLEKLATTLLEGDITGELAATLPFVAAALQVVYTGLAARLDAATLQRLEASNLCPCCGSPAVASVVRLGAAINNLRYLHCSLCNSEWNVPRATCTSCGNDKDVALHELQGSNGAVRAETCDACNGYLKIVYQEKDPDVDPVADDLATLTLDLLLDEAGYQRSGPNFLLLGAQAPAPTVAA